MKLPPEFEFLTKIRFWTMVLAGVMIYLQQKGWVGEEEALLVGGISAAFWATQTIDRATERVGRTEVDAKIEAVEKQEIGGGLA